MLLSALAHGPTLSFDFPLSRSAALARLEAFLPFAGSAYTRFRAEERGQGRHHAVSRLSAALRRRLISEAEVAEAVIAMHGYAASAKFIGELFWRTYWKGWLEQHPSVWQAWRTACAQLADQPLPVCYAEAIGGRTGIDAFDGWARELRETGYLHNWARMQLASIWVFTLKLPWELGAAFTFQHLVDADPASNTLSWRWVAGLHTRGKAYLADADRINAQTAGRFHPTGLAASADVPRETLSPEIVPVRGSIQPDPTKPSMLLLSPEDLSLETEGDLAVLDVRRVVACRQHCGSAADIAAVADGLQRASTHWGAPASWVDDVGTAVVAAGSGGLEQIVTGYAPVGPVAESLAPYRDGARIRIAEHCRAWDEHAWPHCRKGYFAFAHHIPALLQGAGLAP
ncbi:FAD-binding domain-containing protein [Sphingomonas sp.]|uniref:FAD-binding domain-containing protein n=1 Tax=Sphingomonas sp. TaxID=28214 RepID=UPI0028B072C7|nr:FAD-binding domain-containing protein [Sphingomonas sp.]